jgi:mRNA-degrading endonuclease RelE of RelBE toxin-antitoxin system
MNPYDPAVSIPLRGRSDGLRRARVGGLRILFYVEDEIQVVSVTRIAPRGDVYKDV